MKNNMKQDILKSFADGFPLLSEIYNIYDLSPAISKDQENTLRRSLEMNVLEVIELVVVTHNQRSKEAKLETLRQAQMKIDIVKVFIDMATKTQKINKKSADSLLKAVENITIMINGWVKALKATNELTYVNEK